MVTQRKEDKAHRAEEKISLEAEERRERKTVSNALAPEKKKEFTYIKQTKRTSANNSASNTKRVKKVIQLSRTQLRIAKDNAIYQEQCKKNKAYRSSEEGKKEFERLRQIDIKDRKARRITAKKRKAQERKVKKPTKPLYKWKNPISLDFSDNGDQGQGYAMTTPATKPGTRKYILQTYIGGMPNITPAQAEALRDSVKIRGKKTTRRREFFENLENILRSGEKSNSLAVTTVIGTDFNIERTQVLNHQQNVSHCFSNKDNIAHLIQNPPPSYVHENLHLNRLVDFSHEYYEIAHESKSAFIDELNKQEDIPQNKSAFLTADELVGTLRCFTNNSVTKYFNENKIPHFSYDMNPKSKQPTRNKPVAPITNPYEDPRAAVNALQLQYFLQTGEALLSEKQIRSMVWGGLADKTSWSSNNKPPSKRRDLLKAV